MNLKLRLLPGHFRLLASVGELAKERITALVDKIDHDSHEE